MLFRCTHIDDCVFERLLVAGPGSTLSVKHFLKFLVFGPDLAKFFLDGLNFLLKGLFLSLLVIRISIEDHDTNQA